MAEFTAQNFLSDKSQLRINCATGDGGAIVGLRIGTPLFVTQRDLGLAALQRLKPELLAQQMAAEYLQHDRR